MEVITSPQPIPVVKVRDLAMIPSAQQVRQAISNLYKKQEEVPNQLSYIKFPFGILDYDGLQKVLEHHEHKLQRRLESEEKEWLRGCESLCCNNIGINTAKVKHIFEAQIWDKCNKQVCGNNFVGVHWISDTDIDTQLDIVNKQCDNTLCFASKPNNHLHTFSQEA